MAAFTTVSLMREPPGIIRRFIEFYRRAGASEILIYYDGPVPAMSVEYPAVLVQCDAAFWARRGGRPNTLERRQSEAFRAGMERCRTPWLLVVDADEFVFGNRDITDLLDNIPEKINSVRVPTAEAVWGPGDAFGVPFAQTFFRTAWPDRAISRILRRLVFGRISAHMRRGLTGHARGKQFFRVNRSISEIRNHSVLRDGRKLTLGLGQVDRRLKGMYLGHFDAVDLDHWQRKWRMRAETTTVEMTKERKALMALFLAVEANGDRPTPTIFARCYRLTWYQYLMLFALGRGFRRRIFAPAEEVAETPIPERRLRLGATRT